MTSRTIPMAIGTTETTETTETIIHEEINNWNFNIHPDSNFNYL